jgi:hypothetical protein
VKEENPFGLRTACIVVKLVPEENDSIVGLSGAELSNENSVKPLSDEAAASGLWSVCTDVTVVPASIDMPDATTEGPITWEVEHTAPVET